MLVYREMSDDKSAVGSMAPDFTQPDRDGKPIKLVGPDGKTLDFNLRGHYLDNKLEEILGKPNTP